jgi:serine/threonine protein kinase
MALPARIENVERPTLALGEVLLDPASDARFRVTGFLGRGNMGEVHLAETVGTGAPVAIKTILLRLAAEPKVAIRTQFESEALRLLRHRNLVEVYASGVRADGIIFMVMEHLRGMTLRELQRVHGRIPIPWSLFIARDIARALMAVHELAVHRDVKPANVHFGADGVVRLLDLGLAKWKRSGLKLTTSGVQLGTLTHMAPEALDDAATIDGRADVWSVGVVLYELLACRHPFALRGVPPENPYTLARDIQRSPHVPLLDVAPLCPPSLARLVDRMLSKDPSGRPASAEELVAAILDELRAFEREHGTAPPIEELTARLVAPGAKPDLSHLQTTALLGQKAVRAQPAALPYLRTAELPVCTTPAEPGRSSEPEPPRVSDVYLKRRPLQETMPATLLDAPPPPELPATPRGKSAASILAMAAVIVLSLSVGILGTLRLLAWLGVDPAPANPGAAPSAAPSTNTTATPHPGGAARPLPSQPAR